MNSKQKNGIALMAIVFGLAISTAITTNEAEARVELPNAILQGDLTAPNADKPFGGSVVGSYSIQVKDAYSVVYVDFNQQPSPGTVFEGWLVDVDSGEKTSFGTFQEYRNRDFITTIDNQFNADLIVITEEPRIDSDPAPATPVGGAVLGTPFGL
ncbi:MAG: exported protein of unknown function [Nitrosopumilales archaeon]|nr:MAG: exported protein of unknown function [Nitrosopumilales archaeon]